MKIIRASVDVGIDVGLYMASFFFPIQRKRHNTVKTGKIRGGYIFNGAIYFRSVANSVIRCCILIQKM